MFSLDSTMRYWLYNRPVNMCKLEELNRALEEKRRGLEVEGQKKQAKIEHMQSVIDSLRNMMAWFRKNYLFFGNHETAVRAAIVYSLFSSCKAHDIDVRSLLEDTLKRIPTEKDINQLLPCNWRALPANSYLYALGRMLTI